MRYIRIFLVMIWVAVGSTLGLIVGLIRWGDLDNNGRFGRILAWGCLPLLGIKVRVLGAEHLSAHQPCVYVANHQSGLDVPVMGSACPSKTLIIGKKELKWVPFFGLLFGAGGNLFIDRKNRIRALAGLAAITRALKERGASIFVFPEGTRNRSTEPLLPFKKGAFHMAIDAQVPIVPIVITPLKQVLDMNKGVMGGIVTIQALPPLPTLGLKSSDLESLSHATREKMLEALRGLKHPIDHP